MRTVKLLISGRVQGIGYRSWTEHEACALGLSGWVRNLPSGEVEALIAGDEVILQSMIDRCKQGPRFAKVTDIKVEWDVVTEPLTGFEIRR